MFHVEQLSQPQSLAQPERCRWEETDGVADSFARRGESEARAGWRPMVETQTERTMKLLRKKTPPARPIRLNRSVQELV